MAEIESTHHEGSDEISSDGEIRPKSVRHQISDTNGYNSSSFEEENNHSDDDNNNKRNSSFREKSAAEKRIFSKRPQSKSMFDLSKTKPARPLSNNSIYSSRTFHLASKSPSPHLLESLLAPHSPSPTPNAYGSSSSKVIAQRINSAKQRARKEKMNSIKLLERENKDLKEENRLLNRQVKRQLLELDRLEGTKGELPTILHAHNEEVRALKQRLKRVQEANKELESKLNKRDNLLFKMREQNRSLTNLTQNKKLDEREKLQMEIKDLQNQLTIRDEENTTFRRTLTLKERNFKHQLSNERGKQVSLVKQLEEAQKNIDKLRDQLKEKEKIINRNNIYSHRDRKSNRSRSSISGSSSMISLNHLSVSTSHLPEEDQASSVSNDISTVKNYVLEKHSEVRDEEPPEPEDTLDKKRDNLRKNTFVKIAAENPQENDTLVENDEKVNETAEKRPNSLMRMQRQNSFKSTKQFFQENGLIQEKVYPKNRRSSRDSDNIHDEPSDTLKSKDIAPEDKVALWMPKRMLEESKTSTRSSSISSPSHFSVGSPSGNVKTPPRRPSTSQASVPDDKSLSESQRHNLLSKLSAIDNENTSKSKEKMGNGKVCEETYSPSFGPATKQREKTLLSSDDPSRTFKSSVPLNASIGSSIASEVVTTSNKKDNLMKELFPNQ